jgi:hypothetical protein
MVEQLGEKKVKRPVFVETQILRFEKRSVGKDFT